MKNFGFVEEFSTSFGEGTRGEKRGRTICCRIPSAISLSQGEMRVF